MKKLPLILIEVSPKLVKSISKILLKKALEKLSKRIGSNKKKLVKLPDSEGLVGQEGCLPSQKKVSKKTFFSRHKGHIIKILSGTAIEIFVLLIFN